jgi:phospholipid-translocating ATPase
MELKKLHMGTVVFGFDSMDEVAHLLASTPEEDDLMSEFCQGVLAREADFKGPNARRKSSMPTGLARTRRDMSSRVKDAVLALATCHNVSHVPL